MHLMIILPIAFIFFSLFYVIYKGYNTKNNNKHNINSLNTLENTFDKYENIPKEIHVSWKNKDFIDKTTFMMIKHGIYNMKVLNPEYKFIISDDDDVDKYLLSNLNEDDYNLIKNKKIVEKVDLWRLLKMYNEGGIYVDIDRLCNIPLREVIKKNTKCIIPIYRYHDFSQDIMISCPRNIFHKTAIELNLKRRREGVADVIELGPKTYMHAISLCLLNKQINSGCEKNTWDELIAIIDQCPYLQTYIEYPLFNTLLYRGPPIIYDKSEFYADQKVVHHSVN